MTIGVDNGLTQSIIWNFKFILTNYSVVCSTGKIEVLEKESHCSINQLEYVADILLIVDEILFISSFEPGKTQSALRVIGKIFTKENRRRIADTAVLNQIKSCQRCCHAVVKRVI